MKPRIPVTDPAFKYTPAIETDIGKRFAKVRAELTGAELERQFDEDMLAAEYNQAQKCAND